MKTTLKATLTLFALAVGFILVSPACSQESDRLLEAELGQFPWYDAESSEGRLKDLERPDPGRANSLDRFSVPLRINKTKQNQAPPPPGTQRSNMAWARTLIWVVLIVVFLAIVAVFVWVFFKMESTGVKRSNQDSMDEEDLRERIKQLPFQFDEESGDFRTRAAEAAKKGDFGRATMLLFSHVLILLDENRLILLKKGKTNRQYLGELTKHDEIRTYFERVMIPFEDHFFGDHTIEEQRFASCWNDLDNFLSRVETVSKGIAI